MSNIILSTDEYLCHFARSWTPPSEAGREMDAYIAHRLMGWRLEGEEEYDDDGQEYTSLVLNHPTDPGAYLLLGTFRESSDGQVFRRDLDINNLPTYSTDPQATVGVIDVLLNLGMKVEISREGNQYRVACGDRHSSAYTLALAVCRIAIEVA